MRVYIFYSPTYCCEYAVQANGWDEATENLLYHHPDLNPDDVVRFRVTSIREHHDEYYD